MALADRIKQLQDLIPPLGINLLEQTPKCLFFWRKGEREKQEKEFFQITCFEYLHEQGIGFQYIKEPGDTPKKHGLQLPVIYDIVIGADGNIHICSI